MSASQPTSLYDSAAYYDLIFGSATAEEYTFLRDCFELYAKNPVRRIYEPGAGSGRLLAMFAKNGNQVFGCDLSTRAVAACNRRLKRLGHPSTVAVAPMEAYTPPVKVDAAFNLVSSFQHLRSNATAKAHLQQVARSLNPGGIYVLGLQLLPTKDRRPFSEKWSGKRGNLVVETALSTIRLDRKKRQERCRLVWTVRRGTERQTTRESLEFRTYTRTQMQWLISEIPEFSHVASYDFTYQVYDPIEIGPSSVDVIYILKRKGSSSRQ